jgi:hypothetical protein
MKRHYLPLVLHVNGAGVDPEQSIRIYCIPAVTGFTVISGLLLMDPHSPTGNHLLYHVVAVKPGIYPIAILVPDAVQTNPGGTRSAAVNTHKCHFACWRASRQRCWC